MPVDLTELRDRLNLREAEILSPRATFSRDAIRERPEDHLDSDHRQPFAIDADRILHSLAYTRYIDKTQVFSLIPNDHLTHRVLHVQLVSKISRTVGRFLGLNEDLLEAIALGHDIGHPPFGHDGERILSELCLEAGLPRFMHNVQGVHFLRRVERKGRGCNLTLQTLDGILCHDGEADITALAPSPGKTFERLDREIDRLLKWPETPLRPTTLEGCVVRLADTVAYVGRDIEDAVRLRLIRRDDLPPECVEVLGRTNGTIVYRLVTDLITHSLDRDEVGFSPRVAEALTRLKAFNMARIYSAPQIKTEAPKIRSVYRALFEKFYEDLEKSNEDSVIFTDFLDGMDPAYRESPPAAVVRDFIAGMTDAYFLRLARDLLLPRRLPPRF
nr:HD domain-containing protein [Dissulfurirhabdus thermomarina]